MFSGYYAVFLILFNLIYADQSIQCGDWDVFKDEKCIKIFDNKELKNFEDAKNICHQNEESSLVTIRSQEEQEFLYNLLHNIHKSFNDVWIGAQFKENCLKWNENITVNYTNWANGYPRNDSGYECVLMEMVGQTAGKWLNEPCERNHAVVCEKQQNMLLSYLENLQKAVIELRVSNENLALNFKTIKQELDNTKNEINKTIIDLLEINKIRFGNLDNELEDSKNILKTLSSQLDNTKKDLDINKIVLNKTVIELNLTKSELNNTKINLEINKIRLENTVKELNSTKKELDNTKIEMTKSNVELQSTKNEIQSNKKDLDVNKNKLENSVIELKTLIEKSSEFSPTGTIAYFSKTSPPKGWLKANGQSVSRITYANLFATIGTNFGSGDGISTFNLPDLRGEFIRGWSDGRDVDIYRSFGSIQLGSSIPTIDGINGEGYIIAATGWQNYYNFAGKTFDDGFEHAVPAGQTRNGLTLPDQSNSHVHYIAPSTNDGYVSAWNLLKGTRPRNIALLACIKY